MWLVYCLAADLLYRLDREIAGLEQQRLGADVLSGGAYRQVTPTRRGVRTTCSLGYNAQPPFGHGQLLHDVRFQRFRPGEAASAEAEPHHRMAPGPVVAGVDVEARTRGGSEVDFVLYGAAGFWAIEVKNGRSLRPADLRGVRAFHQDYPEATPLVLYRGADTLHRNGVRCMPVDRFLRDLAPNRKFPT